MTFGAQLPGSGRHHHRCVIARADVRLYDAAGCPFRGRGGGEHVVEAPTDVAGAQVSPRRPPRKQIRIVGIKLSTHVHELRAEECFEQRALLRALADGVRLPLLGMHVHLGARDVHVAAQNQLPAIGRQPRGPVAEARYECELRRVILAAVRHIDRCDDQVAMLHLHDARLHVERRMAEDGIDCEQILPDVQRYARIPFQGVPVRVVVGELGFGGDLRRRRLQFLEAHHIGPVSRQPLGQLGGAGANPVDVPRGDFHARNDKPLTAPGWPIHYHSVMKPSGYALDATFAALADPTRRAILARLADGEATVTELAAPFAMSQPAISKHLKVLERAGLITRGREAQRRPRKLEPRPLAEATDWIERYRKIWEANFKRLDAVLQELKHKQKKTIDALLDEVKPKPTKKRRTR